MNAEDDRVEALLAAMKALAHGTFDAPLPESPERDDVARIMDAFEHLRDVLAARESSMRQTEQLTVLLQEVNQQLSTSRQQLARLAEQDPLTELANRRAFLSHVERRMAAVEKGAGPFALLYLDLDLFKPINDQHGHRAGDAVLQSVARSIQGALRSVDVAARLGGDEFAALLEAPRPSGLTALGDRLLRQVCRPLLFEGVELSVSASVGIVICDGQDASPDALLERADQAMYAAKAAGGGRAMLVAPEPRSA
jgi:diguanylate cyclase (GGDEF)-like protein